MFPVSILTQSRAHKQGEGVNLTEPITDSVLEMDVIPCAKEVDNGALEEAQSVVKPSPKSETFPLLTWDALMDAQKRTHHQTNVLPLQLRIMVQRGTRSIFHC